MITTGHQRYRGVREPHVGQEVFTRTVSRKCAQLTARHQKCQQSALPWLPEIEVCAQHVPVDLIGLSEARRSLFAELLQDSWRTVLALLPFPGA